MTVSTEISREHYVGNGKTTVFDYRFRIFSHEDLRVEIADAQNQLTPLTLNTDFTVLSGASEQGGKIQLKKPLAENWHITLERQLPVTQETDLRNQGHFFPEVHEDVFDKLTMLIQQVIGKWGLELRKPSWLANYFDARQQRIIKLADPVDAEDAATKGYADTLDKKTNQHIETLNNATNNRALRVPEAVISPIPNAATRAGKLLSFDALGAPIAALPPTGTAADVLTELAKSDGATKIGSQQPDGKSETVQQALSAIRKAVGSVNTLVSRGQVPALSGKNQGTPGIQMYEAYRNGYPTPYGNVIHLKGASTGGEGELLIGWSGTSISGAHAPLYIRSRRDVGNAPWSAWAQVFTANDIQAYTEAELDKRYQPKGAYGQPNTAKREVNGWWKCGDSGLIIQWGRYGKDKGSWTYDFPLPIRFPNAGLFCIGHVGAAVSYGEDTLSQSAHLVDNTTVRVTIDGGLETAVLAIGF